MPDSPHAASVCMPLWEHNVAYEKGDQAVISAFNSGYPRFFMNPLVTQLRAKLAQRVGLSADDSLLLPTESSAKRCAEYVRHRGFPNAKVSATDEGVWLVHSRGQSTALREFWQHGGEILSSRTAELCLAGGSQSITATAAKEALRERIAELQHVAAGDVYLFPSGMAAIYAAWRITQNDAAPIQFGFPYVDTFKILERFGTVEPWFFPNGSAADIEELSQRLQSQSASALFCEVPGNPLLTTPDVPRLCELARAHDFAMVIDDTLGAMLNVDARPYADLITTSLTKFFSGQGDVLGGSLCLVPDSPNYPQLKARLEAEYEDLFCDADAEVLLANSVNVRQRVTAINRSTKALVEALRGHPKVEALHYPSEDTQKNFEALRDSHFATGGYGGLLSVVPKNAEQAAPKIYDALQVCKGPNLGTNFTLCCPYTILAHYEELDFATDCGVSPYLLRISVGLEPTDWIVERVLSALAAGDS